MFSNWQVGHGKLGSVLVQGTQMGVGRVEAGLDHRRECKDHADIRD